MALSRRSKRKARSDDELLKEFKLRLDSSKRHMQPIMERVERARAVIKGTTDPNYGKVNDPENPREWHSLLFPQIVYEKWEVKNAELTIDTPRVDFIARDPAYEENAELAEDAVSYHYDQDRFNRTFRMAMRAATRDGGAVVKTIWDKRTEIAFDDDGQPILNADGDFTRVTTYSGVRNMLLRLEDIFPDPTANDFPECAWVIQRFYATTEDLKARDGFYSNLDKLPQGGGASGDEKKRDGETQEAFDARRKGVHTCYEMWTPYSRLTVANSCLVIRRDDRLAHKHGSANPFTMIRTIDDEDCIVGVALGTLADPLQGLYWQFLNKLVDAVSLAANPPKIADTEEDPHAASQEIYPGSTLDARNGKQTLMIMQDVAQLSNYNVDQLLEMILALMDRITGITAALAGVSDAATATEASINVRQGKGRVGAEMAVSDEQWCEVAHKTYSLIQQYQSDEVTATLSGGQKVSFKPEQLVDMMITPKHAASERALKDLERQDLQSLWQIIEGTFTDPAAQMPHVDATDTFKRLLTAFGGNPRDVAPAASAGVPMDEAGNAINPADILPSSPEELAQGQGVPSAA